MPSATYFLTGQKDFFPSATYFLNAPKSRQKVPVQNKLTVGQCHA
jgi:hypothetical protein